MISYLMLLFLFRASNRRSLYLYNFASLSVGLHRGKKYWIIIPVPATSHTHKCKHTPWFHLSLQLINLLLQLLYLSFAFLLMLLGWLIKRKKIIVYGEKKSFKKINYLSSYPEECLQSWSHISGFFLGLCLISHWWWFFDWSINTNQ